MIIKEPERACLGLTLAVAGCLAGAGITQELPPSETPPAKIEQGSSLLTTPPKTFSLSRTSTSGGIPEGVIAARSLPE